MEKIRMACGQFHIWAGGPRCYEKKQAEQAREQNSKQKWPLLRVLPPGTYLEFPDFP